MPRVVTALMQDAAVGCLLGAAFLMAAAWFDPFGIAGAFADVPVLVRVAVILGGIVPFALCFAATGLEFRTREDRGD